MPGWVERECICWLVELWSRERAECGAARLWEVDRKYTRMLDQLTIAELMTLLRRCAPSTAPAEIPRETN
jgi:hypothetical protein